MGPAWATSSTVKATPYSICACRGGGGGAMPSVSSTVVLGLSSARAGEADVASATNVAPHIDRGQKAAPSRAGNRLFENPCSTATTPAYIANAHADVDRPRLVRILAQPHLSRVPPGS